MTNFKMLLSKNRERHKDGSNFLFYCLLLYTIAYYSQLGSRVRILGQIRIEFLLGVLIVLFALPRFIRKITLTQEEKLIIFPLIAFLVAATISLSITVAGYHSIDMYILFIKALVIFIMIYGVIDTETELKRFLYVLVAMAAFITLESFYNSFSGHGFRVFGSGLSRLEATTRLFAHPNSLGGLIAGTLPLVYLLFSSSQSRITQFILVALAIIMVRVIILTQSRSAFLGLLALIVYLFIIAKRKVYFAIALFLVCSIGWPFLDQGTRDRYLSILDANEVVLGEEIRNEAGEIVDRGSMVARYEIITDGLTLFLENPIIGVGVGAYQIARIERFGRWQVAHNAYIQCLAELGIIGFIPWVFLLTNTFRLFSKVRRKITELKEMREHRFVYHTTYGFQGYLFVHFTLSMFGHTPYKNYWWIPAAVSLILLRFVKRAEHSLEHHDHFASSALQSHGRMSSK